VPSPPLTTLIPASKHDYAKASETLSLAAARGVMLLAFRAEPDQRCTGLPAQIFLSERNL
jgi:hypothetical protein